MGGSAVALLAHEIHSAERTFAHHEEPDRGRGVRNASSIAEAAVAAAKTQTVRLPGEEVAEFHRQAGFGASFSAGIAAMYAALNGDGIPFAGQGTQRLRGERRLETVLTDAT